MSLESPRRKEEPERPDTRKRHQIVPLSQAASEREQPVTKTPSHELSEITPDAEEPQRDMEQTANAEIHDTDDGTSGEEVLPPKKERAGGSPPIIPPPGGELVSSGEDPEGEKREIFGVHQFDGRELTPQETNGVLQYMTLAVEHLLERHPDYVDREPLERDSVETIDLITEKPSGIARIVATQLRTQEGTHDEQMLVQFIDPTDHHVISSHNYLSDEHGQVRRRDIRITGETIPQGEIPTRQREEDASEQVQEDLFNDELEQAMGTNYFPVGMDEFDYVMSLAVEGGVRPVAVTQLQEIHERRIDSIEPDFTESLSAGAQFTEYITTFLERQHATPGSIIRDSVDEGDIRMDIAVGNTLEGDTMIPGVRISVEEPIEIERLRMLLGENAGVLDTFRSTYIRTTLGYTLHEGMLISTREAQLVDREQAQELPLEAFETAVRADRLEAERVRNFLRDPRIF
jgi:hypothetical protein